MNNVAHVSSPDFEDSVESRMVALQEETVNMIFYRVFECKNTKIVPSTKYGAHMARFTHHQRQVLHASTKRFKVLAFLYRTPWSMNIYSYTVT
jgi:COMPASS component SWD2